MSNKLFSKDESTFVFRLLEEYKNRILGPLPSSYIEDGTYQNWEVIELIWSIQEKMMENSD